MPFPGALIHTPVTDFSALADQKTRKRQCRPLAMQYARCQDAYGFPHHVTKCRDEFEDLEECSRGLLQTARATVIRHQRMKLYQEGKLEQQFIVPPPDSISQEHGVDM